MKLLRFQHTEDSLKAAKETIGTGVLSMKRFNYFAAELCMFEKSSR